jgi:hypothetical protein
MRPMNDKRNCYIKMTLAALMLLGLLLLFHLLAPIPALQLG